MTRTLALLAVAALILLVGAAATPVRGQEAACWSGTGCALAMTPGKPHVAEVTCRNRVTSGAYRNDALLISEGMAVGLAVDHGAGDLPDLFSVTPPDGFVADPVQLSLPENGAGVVRIWDWSGS